MSDFPTKENPQLCKNNCGTKIYLSNQNDKRKWLPYELDGEFHDCPNKPGLDKFSSNAATTTEIIDITGQKGQKEPTIGQLKIWIDRLEKVGIHIDVNEILNPKKEQETTKFPPGV